MEYVFKNCTFSIDTESAGFQYHLMVENKNYTTQMKKIVADKAKSLGKKINEISEEDLVEEIDIFKNEKFLKKVYTRSIFDEQDTTDEPDKNTLYELVIMKFADMLTKEEVGSKNQKV